MVISRLDSSQEPVARLRVEMALPVFDLNMLNSCAERLFDISSISPRESQYERHYAHARYNFRQPLLAADCSPPTPVSYLNAYTSQVNGHRSVISSAVASIDRRDLQMGPLAQAIQNYVSFIRTLPGFCIGDDNRDAFNALQAVVTATGQRIDEGVTSFEANFGVFLNNAVPILESVKRESDAITPASRDFRPVVEPFNRYNNWVDEWRIEVWGLSDAITAFHQSWQTALSGASSSFTRAYEQIQQNIESESRRFQSARVQCNDHLRRWDEIDGLQGFLNFKETLRYVGQDLIPPFNDFLAKVPATDRTRQAVANAQEQVDAIVAMYNSFPTFDPLPASTDEFPHDRYGLAARKFGRAPIIEIVRTACVAYYDATQRRLAVGDMAYEHGGRASPHASHRQGIDADVDPIEMGRFGQPGYNAEQALEAAQIFLSAGAVLVFFADPSVVNLANQWAQTNNISGRLQVEAGHTGHFHLRS